MRSHSDPNPRVHFKGKWFIILTIIISAALSEVREICRKLRTNGKEKQLMYHDHDILQSSFQPAISILLLLENTHAVYVLVLKLKKQAQYFATHRDILGSFTTF